MARVPFFFLSFSLVYHHYTCSNNLKIGSLKSDIKITRDDISTETLKIFGSSTALKMNMNWHAGHPQWWFSRLLFFEASDFITPFRLVPLHWSIIPFNDSVLKREKITAKSWWKERLCRKCARDIHSIFGTEKKKTFKFFLASFKGTTFSFILMVTWFHFHMGKATYGLCPEEPLVLWP